MPVIPYYAQGIAELSCCSCGSGNTNVYQQIEALKKVVEEQVKRINELEQALSEKINSSDLVTVYSLENSPLFKAFPLDVNN